MSFQAPPPLVPLPARIEMRERRLRLDRDIRLRMDDPRDAAGPALSLLGEALSGNSGTNPGSAGTGGAGCTVLLSSAEPGVGGSDEAYRLSITPRAAIIHAGRSSGFARGVQTLRQLARITAAQKATGAPALPCLEILDHPRFRWRGSLLDSCRHIQSMEFIKRYIDLMAFHRMNVFHWHLSDDQGWRIEIRRFPRLREVGAWRDDGRGGRYGGFFSRGEVREIVSYAAEREVLVVPEIELPGHALAALAAYPELSCSGGPFRVPTAWGVFEDVFCLGKESVFEFLCGVLEEVAGLFPGPYIHVGGDECPVARWRECPDCRRRARDEGLGDPAGLQSWFLARIAERLAEMDKRLAGWDEILEGGAPADSVIQCWRGTDRALAALRAGHCVIMSPTSHCFLDYSTARIPLRRAYEFDARHGVVSRNQRERVLGLEGNLWTEHTPTEDDMERQAFPRLCALAESAWTLAERRDWNSFSGRLPGHLRILRGMGLLRAAESPEHEPGISSENRD